MKCPHCLEYDIEAGEIELEPIYTEREKLKMRYLEEDLDDAYRTIDNMQREINKLRGEE